MVLRATDTAWRSEDGVFYTHSGQAWLWRVLPQVPLTFEDAPARRADAARWHAMLCELGQTSRTRIGSSKYGAFHREIHISMLAWDYAIKVPNNPTAQLDSWLQTIFREFSAADGVVAIGVRLKPKQSGATKGFSYLRRQLNAIASTFLGSAPDPQLFAVDKSQIVPILGRAGGRAPTNAEADRLTHWWNGGRAADAKIMAEPSGRVLSCDAWPEGLVFSALIDAEEALMNPDDGLWLADAFSHSEGCVAVSIRGELWTNQQMRALARKRQRNSLDQMREQAKTADLEKVEDEEGRELSAIVEESARTSGEPYLVNASIIAAHRDAALVDDDYTHLLQQKYGLSFKPVEYRQVEALREMLPGGVVSLARRKPFSQILSLGVVSHSGVGAFANIGDKSGVWMGLALHDMVPVWLDIRGSSKGDKPPAMAVVGEPGSGKTFFLQLLTTQAALSGESAVFINPKPADSLDGFAAAVGGETIKVSANVDQVGLLDPFRFAEPQLAAQIATSHILGVLTELNEEEEVGLGGAITAAAEAGARCVGEALNHADVPPRVRDLVAKQVQASPLFGIGVSQTAQPELGFANRKGGLTLIEFERSLSLPSGSAPARTLERETRIGLAALRLVSRAALEQMLRSGGGLLVIDEAHTFLGSEEGRTFLQRLGREGRSQGILPVLATQRIADVIAEGTDLGSYLGRVMVMRMDDRREADAALELLGLEPTQRRRDWLAAASPVRGVRGALGMLRDLQGRCSAVMVGPVPDDILKLFSTNPLDRVERSNSE